jgi:beta-mannanase
MLAIVGILGVAAAAAVLAVPFLAGSKDAPALSAAAQEQLVTVPVPDPERNPQDPVRRVLAPEHGVYLGVSNFTLVADTGAVAAWTEANGPHPRIVNWFQQWLSGERRFRPDWARRVARAGAVPMITWEPWSAPEGVKHVAIQPDVSLARIADGSHDGYIRAWARDVAAYRGPVMIRLMHEMNGDWYPWGVTTNGNTPELYIQAWRHVHRIFDAAGARNVSWIWSINNLERIAGENHDIDAYYPGDRFVDWVSTSGFNWGNAYSWSSWRTADPLYRETYRALTRYDKPIMISEIGTTSDGGDARVWIRQTFQTLRADYPKLHAVLWYDDVDGGGLDFRLQGQIAGALSQPGTLGSGWLQEPRFTTVP